jgi:hypothetical protein
MAGKWPDAVELDEREGRRKRIWFGLLGGAVAWLLHLMSAYAIAEFGCVSWLGTLHWIGVSAVAWLCIGVSTFCELLALFAVLAAYRCVRSSRSTNGDFALQSRQYAASLGLGVSILFAFAIAFESIPIVYYLQGC